MSCQIGVVLAASSRFSRFEVALDGVSCAEFGTSFGTDFRDRVVGSADELDGVDVVVEVPLRDEALDDLLAPVACPAAYTHLV
jgi:hypothetical protein